MFSLKKEKIPFKPREKCDIWKRFSKKSVQIGHSGVLERQMFKSACFKRFKLYDVGNWKRLQRRSKNPCVQGG